MTELETKRRYIATHPEYREKQRASARRYYAAHREELLAKRRILKQRGQYQRRQREKLYRVKYPEITNCEVCGKEITGRQIALDHDHETGLFRGWLCHGCNYRIEWVQRYGRRVDKYLERAKIRTIDQKVLT